MVNFIKNHPYLTAATAGLALVGHLGYRAVHWILEKTGLVRKVDSLAPKTIDVPADGSCLFHSFILASGVKIDHETLRRQVVAWLEAHAEDPTIRLYMEQAFNQEKEERINDLKQQIHSLWDAGERESAKRVSRELRRLRNIPFTPRLYLERMKKTRTFASEPEIYALSNLYPVRIHIHPGDTIYPSEEKKGKDLHVRLQGKHYNVVVP